MDLRAPLEREQRTLLFTATTVIALLVYSALFMLLYVLCGVSSRNGNGGDAGGWSFSRMHALFKLLCYGFSMLYNWILLWTLYPWIWGAESELLWHPSLTSFDSQPLPNVVYGIQLGYYLHDILCFLFWRNERQERRDTGLELFHHFVVLFLIFSSWSLGQMRIGCLLVLIMDPTDFIMNLTKGLKYAGKEAATTAAFGLFVTVWVYLRLYTYALKILVPSYSTATAVLDQHGITWRLRDWYMLYIAVWAIWLMQWIWSGYIVRALLRRWQHGSLEDTRYQIKSKRE